MHYFSGIKGAQTPLGAQVCKLRLENDPHDYGSKYLEHILQSSVERKPK